MHSPPVAWAAVSAGRWFCCCCYIFFDFQLFVGVQCLSLFRYALLCVHSSFAITLKRQRKLVALLVLLLQMYCYCKCSVTLPHRVVGWSAVCNCGISWLYSLTFWLRNKITILNKSENATPELFAIYIKNYANQECSWNCIWMFKYLVMHSSKSFPDVVTRIHMKAI